MGNDMELVAVARNVYGDTVSFWRDKNEFPTIKGAFVVWHYADHNLPQMSHYETSVRAAEAFTATRRYWREIGLLVEAERV